MPGEDSKFVDFDAHLSERLCSGNTRGMPPEQSKSFVREERLVHQRTQSLEGGHHRLLRSMGPTERRKQWSGSIVDEVSLGTKPLDVAESEVERAGEPGQIAKAAPRSLDPK